MKPWHKFVIGVAASVAVGSIAYTVYHYQNKSSSQLLLSLCSPSISITSDSCNQEIDICHIMDEVLIDVIDNITAYARIAEQTIHEHSEEREEFIDQIRKQSLF